MTKGTPVEVRNRSGEWMPAVYVRHQPGARHPHIVAIDGRVRLACLTVRVLEYKATI